MAVSFIYSVLQNAWEHLALSRNVNIDNAICLATSSVTFLFPTQTLFYGCQVHFYIQVIFLDFDKYKMKKIYDLQSVCALMPG
jgi:hypothetical protein